jgi:hypothetical protein
MNGAAEGVAAGTWSAGVTVDVPMTLACGPVMAEGSGACGDVHPAQHNKQITSTEPVTRMLFMFVDPGSLRETLKVTAHRIP